MCVNKIDLSNAIFFFATTTTSVFGYIYIFQRLGEGLPQTPHFPKKQAASPISINRQLWQGLSCEPLLKHCSKSWNIENFTEFFNS